MMLQQAPAGHRAVDVSALPDQGEFGHKGLIWWGTTGFMVIEGSMFVMVLITYFYLRSRRGGYDMANEDEDRSDYWEQRGLVLLWVSMLAGPIASALNLQLGYALVKWACAARRTDVLIVMTIGALATAVVGAALGWWCLEKIGAAAKEQGGRTVDRSYFWRWWRSASICCWCC